VGDSLAVLSKLLVICWVEPMVFVVSTEGHVELIDRGIPFEADVVNLRLDVPTSTRVTVFPLEFIPDFAVIREHEQTPDCVRWVCLHENFTRCDGDDARVKVSIV
jgi:hypothetical protein